MHSTGYAFLKETDQRYLSATPKDVQAFLEKANDQMAAFAKAETQKLLAKVLDEASNGMKNAFARSDA